MKRRKAISRKLIGSVTLAVIAVAIIVAVAFASRIPESAAVPLGDTSVAVGATAPNFDVSTTNGEFNLASVKKPVLLEVFATWCPHCQREVSVLNALCRKYGSRISFVAVCGSPFSNPSDGTPESQNDVIAFARSFDARYPVAFDPDLNVAHAYLKSGFPTIAIIRPNKTISYLNFGEIPEAALDHALADMLKD